MRRLNSFSLLSFVLTVLLAGAGGACQPASAQQPTLDPSAPVTSIDEAVRSAESDSALVDLAVALQSARADTKISFGEYRKGVHLFRQHHPGFYGNFFGDPFYATYDRGYQDLAWERQLAELDINPVNSIRNSTWFFCPPSFYDPAFNGVRKSFKFAASNFSRLPSFIVHRQLKARPETASATEHRLSSPRPFARDQERGASPSNPDTLMRRPDRTDPPADGRATASIPVPEETTSQMQRRASDLQRVEFRQRVQEMIEEEYGEWEALTSEERAELADRLSGLASAPDRPSGTRDDRDHLERGIPSETGDHLERIEQIRDRLEERTDRIRSRPEEAGSFHQPTVPRKPDASPSPSGNVESGDSSDGPPSTSDRDEVQRNGSDESGAQ